MQHSFLGRVGVAAALILVFATVSSAEDGSPALGAWGVDLANMDRSVKPGDDFSQYVNGTWMKTTEIPPDRSRFGAFDELSIMSEHRMRDMLDALAGKTDAELNAEQRKLRDLYLAYTDETGIAARGLKPAKPDLDLIAGLKTLDDVARAMGTRRLGLNGPYRMGIDVNDKDPNAYVVRLGHAGLGMPDRDYYLRDDEALAKTRALYQEHLTKVFAQLGLSDPAGRSTKVYALERRIAEAHWPNADRRDADKTFNPMSITELKTLAPQFPWSIYLKAAGVDEHKGASERQVIVGEKSAFPALAKIFAETPVKTWRDYLIASYIHAFAPALPKAFDGTNFAFYGTVLQGSAKQLDRNIRAARVVDTYLGEILGKAYTERYFPPESKAKMEVLVGNLLKVYDQEIRVLPWMSETTRLKALDKLHKFTPHIGYPEKWRDYSAYIVKRDDLLGDLQRGAQFEWNRELKRIDEPVDKSEWRMTPPTVNAYYTTSFNAIFFPAAILQPPFFDPHADDAVNYGGIGAVIGHEISHGFDDQGSKYDGDGKLENWWTAEDRKAFEASTSNLGKQFDSYEALPGLHVNGAFTMGENIADLAGLTIALKAYHLSLGGKADAVKDGFTGDQRFFLAWGQVWREKIRDATLRQHVLSDAHAPARFRTASPPRNIDTWYDAFGVEAGDTFYLAPADRVRLW